MKCRGTETRKKIVQEYYVKPEAHLMLLANQTIHSDAEATIRGEYYIFSAKSKKDGHKEDMKCGMGAARDFLKLLGHKGVHLFNPLKEELSNSVTNSSGLNTNKNDDVWNPVAKQLYNAIMWIIMLWNAKLDTPLFEFRNDVEIYKSVPPFDWKIKRVNTTIKKGWKGKKLTEIINEYSKHNAFKSNMCEFGLLESTINKMIDADGNKLESFF